MHQERDVFLSVTERRKRQRHQEFIDIIEKTVINKFMNIVEADDRLANYLSMVDNGEIDPYTCSEKVLQGELMKAWATHLAK